MSRTTFFPHTEIAPRFFPPQVDRFAKTAAVTEANLIRLERLSESPGKTLKKGLEKRIYTCDIMFMHLYTHFL